MTKMTDRASDLDVYRSDGTLLQLGDRVLCDSHRAVIQFIGEVPPTSGVWIGVDWDNPVRGKHNGSHEGKQYFHTRHPKSGSFVRPNKVQGGITATQAVKDRYGLKQDQNAGIDTSDLFVLDHHSMQQTQVEMVGAEKVNRLQSQFSKLKSVTLFDMQVYSGGQPGELGAMCPNLTILDLTRSLLPSWESVADIARQLPFLKDLNISDNKLSLPADPASLSSCFLKLKNITMNKMGLSWKEILTCCTMFPVLEELHVCFNNISQLSDSSNILKALKKLDLMTNAIDDWGEVLKLGNLPRLESLVISENHIASVFYPDCGPADKTNQFASLKSLIIKRNKIHDWNSINELNKMQQLEELQLSENPVISTFKYETIRQLLIAKIGTLQLIGRTPIPFEERKGAEIDYLKRFGLEWKKEGGDIDNAKNNPSTKFIEQHPRFLTMCNQWGAPEDSELGEKSSALKNNLLAVNIESSDHPEKGVLHKKLPATMSIEKLKTLIQRMFRVNLEPILTYSSAKKLNGPQIPLDFDMRELGFFSIENGDTIHVAW